MKLRMPCSNCGEAIDVWFNPGYPALRCSNPSSPAYSDPGDPGDCEHPDACPSCNEPVDDDAAWAWCEEELQARRDDALERRAEDMAEQRKYGRYDD